MKLKLISIMTCCEDHIGIEVDVLVVSSSSIERLLCVLLALLTQGMSTFLRIRFVGLWMDIEARWNLFLL